MQDLVVGERYKVSHPSGCWGGECTVTKVSHGVVFYKDMKVTNSHGIGESVIQFLEKEWNQLTGFLFEPVHYNLENK